MTQPFLRVGSRDSALALAQAHHFMDVWSKAVPQTSARLTTYKTTGDQFLESSLTTLGKELGDKGLFVKELEIALLSGEIDVAVHSLKDMPGTLPEGLSLFSFGRREDPRDVLLSKTNTVFDALASGAVIGTSATRRLAMLKRLRPDLTYQNVRGNLQTRYRKLQEGPYDALILAAAGVHRLGWVDRITQYFDPITQLVPAPGQGILAVEFRSDDETLANQLAQLADENTAVAMTAERTVLATLHGGCHTPVGAYAKPMAESGAFELTIQLLHPEGTTCLNRYGVFEQGQAEDEARRLTKSLMEEAVNLGLLD